MQTTAIVVSVLLFLFATNSAVHSHEQLQSSFDVIVYDATPAGIAAAIAAAKNDCDVLLIEPSSRIGGMITGGLSHPDFKTFESLTGAFGELMRRVQSHYESEYGPDSQQAKDCFRGTHAEPKVNLQIFHEMLAEHPRVTLLHNYRVIAAHVVDEGERKRLISASFTGPKGTRRILSANVFIDASYEGDLMAAAGVEYRVGREAHREYGESLAPLEADKRVQGYNFRLILTCEPDNRVMPKAPEGYDRQMFAGILPLLDSGQIQSVFARWRDCIYKAHTPMLPNGKYDINDVSSSPVRLSLPEINDQWPEGDDETRQRIHQQHVVNNVGLLYFLQNDEAVPGKFRDEARQWGFCADEFSEWNHVSSELYVREGRRMQGVRVYTQNDTAQAEGDARAILHPDSIAMGDYGHSCHGTGHVGGLFGGKHTGDFHLGRLPYQVPYGVLLPKLHVNLLVPTACSSSHVGFCALRLEPIWMNMGQAAGIAAGLAVKKDIAVQDVPVETIQATLHERGAATLYVSDVPPGDPDFAMVQWWGTLGGWHGVEDPPVGDDRGPEIRDHYYEAFPHHAALLEKRLSSVIRTRWLEIAKRNGLTIGELQAAETRGEFIREAYRQVVAVGPNVDTGKALKEKVSHPKSSSKLPPLQRDYFFLMPRSRAVIEKIDVKAQTVTATLDEDDRKLTVPIRPDTEIYFRDARGTLADFFPGQHVMLFMLIDEHKNWLYPRALMDDVHLDAGHKRFAEVVHIDPEKRTVATRREDKRKGLIEETLIVSPDVKVWKGDKASGWESLKIGDEIVKQSVRRDGKLIVVELFDRVGVEAVAAIQAKAYSRLQETTGLVAYVTDVEPLNGLVTITVPWRDAARAKELNENEAITITPDDQQPFAATIRSTSRVGKRLRIELHAQAAAAARLDYGQNVRLWLPGTGPKLPIENSGLPE